MSDYNEDLSLIRLSVDKVKSKRNRLVPVPQIVRSHLSKLNDSYNIFTGTQKPYNSGYFKTLFRWFKHSNKSVDDSYLRGLEVAELKEEDMLIV